MPKWDPEGQDAALLAKAILSGVVTEKKSFSNWVDPAGGGEGAAIGQKFGYFPGKNGQRNLNINFRKLKNKLDLWRSNKRDGNGSAFQKKIGLETPDLLEDLEDYDPQGDFIHGKDEFFEDEIKDERAAERDSLSVVGAGESEGSEEENDIFPVEEEDAEHEEENLLPSPKTTSNIKMPPRKKSTVPRELNKQPGQCDVSWEALKPVFGFCDVDDPEMRRRGCVQTRKGITIRVDVPAGIVLSSFVPEISADGKSITFTGHMEQSRCDAKYTLGREMHDYGRGIRSAMTTSLQEYWTRVKQECSDGGGDDKEYKKYVLKLPEACEQDMRDPCRNWEPQEINDIGRLVNIKHIRSAFFYMSYFTVASKNFTPAMASRKKLRRIEEVTDGHAMDAVNLAMTSYRDRYDIDGRGRSKPSRSKSHHKSRHRSRGRSGRNRRHSRSHSPDTISRSFKEMSISHSQSRGSDSSIDSEEEEKKMLEEQKSTSRSSRKSKRNSKDQYSTGLYDESASQIRHKIKGKQRKLSEQEFEFAAEDDDDDLKKMSREQLKQKYEELLEWEKIQKKQTAREERRKKEERRNIPQEVDTNTNVVEDPYDGYDSNKSRSGRSERSERSEPTRRSDRLRENRGSYDSRR